jgi:hypothetical protein
MTPHTGLHPKRPWGHLAAWLTVVDMDVPTLAAIGRLYESFDRNLTRSLDDIYQSDPEMRRDTSCRSRRNVFDDTQLRVE